MNMAYTKNAASAYGCEHFGRLTQVLLHRPGAAMELIDEGNCHDWLFDFAPDIPQFVDEHDRYRDLLISLGVHVHELSDYLEDGQEAIDRLPNLTYLHDTAVVSSQGAFVSQMATPARSLPPCRCGWPGAWCRYSSTGTGSLAT